MYLLILITFILEFLVSYFIPIYFNHLNLFYPMLTLTLIVYLYNKVPLKTYFRLAFIIGFLYDLLFSYIFLFHSLIFLCFAKIISLIDKHLKCNFLISLILLIVFIFLYDFILFALVYLSNYNIVNFTNLLEKFESSIILNAAFYILLSIILNKRMLAKK